LLVAHGKVVVAQILTAAGAPAAVAEARQLAADAVAAFRAAPAEQLRDLQKAGEVALAESLARGRSRVRP